MPREVRNQGVSARSHLSHKLTPYSLLIGIPLFVGFSLIYRNIYTIVLQACFLLSMVLFFGFTCKRFRILPIIPLLLFVVIVNAFRGGGEVLLRSGPLFIMRQGLRRGLYYAVFIVELFMMSSMLTHSFSEDQLVSAFHSLGRPFSGRVGEKNADTFTFTLMLFCILKTFHSTYSQMRVFFRKSPLSFRQRTLLFIHTLFRQVMRDYDRAREFAPALLKPGQGDGMFVLCQLAVLTVAVLMGKDVFGLGMMHLTVT